MIKQLLPYAIAAGVFLLPWQMSHPGSTQEQVEPVPNAAPVGEVTETEKPEAPRRLKLTLTLSAPDDLKVKEGQQVEVGQTLSDRTRERERLTQQRKQLEIALDRLSIPLPSPAPPPPPPPMAQLPEADYSQELSSIALVKNTLESKQLAVKLQREKVEQLQALEVPEIIIEHESALLAQKLQEEERAKLELADKKSAWETAQSDRAYQEYLHSLEMSSRAIRRTEQVTDYSRQLFAQVNKEREREYQKAAVQTQIQGIDNAISEISQVKSPYAGVVRKIRWLPGNDNSLRVELTIVPERKPELPARESELPTREPELPAVPRLDEPMPEPIDSDGSHLVPRIGGN